MRVLMLGWEFPPFITGGLGTACHGLTKALDRRGAEVTFVLPKSVDRQSASHVTLVSPSGEWLPGEPVATASGPQARAVAAAAMAMPPLVSSLVATGAFASADAPRAVEAAASLVGEPLRPESTDAVKDTGAGERMTILGDAVQRGAYGRSEWPTLESVAASIGRGMHGAAAPRPGWMAGAAIWSGSALDLPLAPMHQAILAEHAIRTAIPEAAGRVDSAVALGPRCDDYSGDLVSEAHRYARFVVAACGRLRFDVIHAHDWLTYPAGLALASVTGRPLVVHVHSTEFDRSGMHVNQRIYDIERRGMHGAIKVISVSMLTKNLCVNRYAVPAAKIEVVYNGVDLAPEQVGMEDIQAKDRIVLYFGRITMQKGPEYFVHAAKRVLEVFRDVKFVVAGSGDQAQRMIELAAELGIGHKMLFTGFLRGKDIARVFAMADLYVMPSVSEPFGIAPLEAMGHDVPVLISRTSGVSEVLTNALKCDFWDVDDMANKIVAVLRYPPLQRTLIEHGRFEVRKLTWDGAAARCDQVYHAALTAMGRRGG
jgi:glycogen(starch) synthase